jgi:uncharacterized membrane protein
MLAHPSTRKLFLYYNQTMGKNAARLRTNKKPPTPIINIIERLSFPGLLLGVMLYCLSFTPSLMPRPWHAQAIISGLSFVIGYAVGLLSSTVISWITEKSLPMNWRAMAWRIILILGPLAMVAAAIMGAVWQTDVRAALEIPSNEPSYVVRIVLASIAMGVGVIIIAAVIRRCILWLVAKLDVYFPFKLGAALAVTTTLALGIWVLSGVFFNFAVSRANQVFRSQNDMTPENAVLRDVPERSGSSTSYVSWESMGRQGRRFVGTGPTISDIAEFQQGAAREPIRIYIGVDSAPDAASRAELAVREMRRAGAFERKVLVLVTPTGTGWLEPKTVDAVEYMHGGDTAIVAQQYSYLPSWISFLVDRDVASKAGQALFDTVYEEWSELPEDSRPRLVTHGLSLGAYGSQSAFSSVNAMVRSIDGAYYQGTPNDTRIWRDVTDNREPGSPEWQPVYDDGQAVRFAAAQADIQPDDPAWQEPRIVYAQHASDPIVWFSYDLAYKRPDWLGEPRGPGVSSKVRWYPIITFLQITADQGFANYVPDGRGHVYGNTIVEAWQATTRPDGWTPTLTHRLYDTIYERH